MAIRTKGESPLTPDELDRLLSAVDEVGTKVRRAKGLGPDDPFAIRNALVRHARRLVFQLAEVAVSREVFRQVLERIAGLHPAPG